MTAACEWTVAESDDDWQQYNNTSTTKDATTTTTTTATNDTFFIPVKVALLFKDIELKKTLPLKCSCPRVGVRESNAVGTPRTTTKELTEKHTESEQPKESIDTSKVYEAFDFDDESDKGPASAKRKTPASGVKRAKKEKATLSNVVNDIRRQKLLDDMEAVVKSDNVPETPEPSKAK